MTPPRVHKGTYERGRVVLVYIYIYTPHASTAGRKQPSNNNRRGDRTYERSIGRFYVHTYPISPRPGSVPVIFHEILSARSRCRLSNTHGARVPYITYRRRTLNARAYVVETITVVTEARREANGDGACVSRRWHSFSLSLSLSPSRRRRSGISRNETIVVRYGSTGRGGILRYVFSRKRRETRFFVNAP